MSLIFQNESYAIRGAAMRVYNVLGSGFLEAVYQEALEIELEKRHIPYEREKELEIYYDDIKLGKKYVADFVCYDKIILELKAVKDLDDSHRSQLYNYLKVTGFKLGFLINFGKYDELQIERRVL
ncbi:MAG: GxxExxY protein [Bacteroidales bacterium]|nr:GxxExxY protein [Bacteroidales bacterium]